MGWWTWATKSISECIMARMYLPAVIAISMALNHSVHMLNEDLQNSMVFHGKRFIYTLKECEFRFNHREENLSERKSTLKLSRPYRIIADCWLDITSKITIITTTKECNHCWKLATGS